MAFVGYNIGTKMRIGYDPATGEFGTQMKMANKTGAASVKGTVGEPSSTTDSAFQAITADDPDPICVVYEAGVSDGSAAWVWMVGSLCQMLLEDTTAATRAYWVKVGETTAGRADATNAAPSGSVVAELEEHFHELGHAAESQASGTDVLCLVHFHVN